MDHLQLVASKLDGIARMADESSVKALRDGFVGSPHWRTMRYLRTAADLASQKEAIRLTEFQLRGDCMDAAVEMVFDTSILDTLEGIIREQIRLRQK